MLHADPADDLLAFIHASPTPWHAVDECLRRLSAAGYQPLDERETWSLSPGDRAYVVRGGSSVLALEVGRELPSRAGFQIVGAHTDSPNLRVKPRGETRAHRARQLGVEVYGGVLLHTWLDRDLALAGRLWTRGAHGVEPALVRLDRAIARVPALAIHLDRGVNDDGLRLNAQQHLSPLWGLESTDEASFAQLLAEAAGVDPAGVLSHELCLYDVVPPARGGARGEFLFAPRLDNLASCHAALSALLSASGQSAGTRVIALYDHEECGSTSAQGAGSPLLGDTLERLVACLESGADARPRAMARSFFVSADMAHAVHPNYPDKHEPAHRPYLGAGPVIKANSNQRYATDGESAARFVSLCRSAEVEPQFFVTRTDLACGSTIGPLSAARLGVRTVDVGNPMLSMHSCRELAAAADVAPMIAALRAFFEGR